MLYECAQPFIVDSTKAQTRLGIQTIRSKRPSPLPCLVSRPGCQVSPATPEANVLPPIATYPLSERCGVSLRTDCFRQILTLAFRLGARKMAGLLLHDANLFGIVDGLQAVVMAKSWQSATEERPIPARSR